MAKYEVAMACFHGIGTQLDPERAVPLFDEFCHRYMERYPDSDEVLGGILSRVGIFDW